MKTIEAPANTPGSIRGNVTERNTRHAEAPRFAAACSSDGSTNDNAVRTFTNSIGYRLKASLTTTAPNEWSASQFTGVPACHQTQMLAQRRQRPLRAEDKPDANGSHERRQNQWDQQ